MPSPALERVKIQAEVLVPLLRAFRAEFGTERADRIAGRALAEWRRQVVADRHAALPGRGRDRWMAGVVASIPDIGDAVETTILRQSDAAVDFDVTTCRFAEVFRELGEPELGFALLCAMDDTAVAEIGEGEVALTRTGTIMRGAARCDFRYALKKAAG